MMFRDVQGTFQATWTHLPHVSSILEAFGKGISTENMTWYPGAAFPHPLAPRQGLVADVENMNHHLGMIQIPRFWWMLEIECSVS